MQIEYSAREISPPALLLQHILRAHQIFLLHQATSITDLYARIGRIRFCSLVKHFWDGFIRNWDVLLHGNPAVDVFNGLKLAAGGELGVGVGEEVWGSGEREVLEGFIGRSEGLVDLVVSRFGDTPNLTDGLDTRFLTGPIPQEEELLVEKCANYAQPSDGVVFSGVGALTRFSVKAVSSWMEWLHVYSKDAYGVRDNPSYTPRRKRRKAGLLRRPSQTLPSQSDDSRGELNITSEGLGIPPSIMTRNKSGSPAVGSSILSMDKISKNEEQATSNDILDSSVTGTETLVKYLTLGVYGSTWGIPSGRPVVQRQTLSLHDGETSQSQNSGHASNKGKIAKESGTLGGYFLIGLQGELEDGVPADATDPATELTTTTDDVSEEHDTNDRVMMRSLYVERSARQPTNAHGINVGSISTVEAVPNFCNDRLRVVVYVQKPFIFTFLFESQTDALAMPSFYRSLHHLLGPLRRPLLVSTSPTKVSERVWEAAAPRSTASTTNTQPVWDLIYDPERLTVHTTIPNIPEPGLTSTDSYARPPWSRIEALSVHSQILQTYVSTRNHMSELERTCKTSRGWWVVWMRVPLSTQEESGKATTKRSRVAFLVRQASDYASLAARNSSGRFGRDISGGSGTTQWVPGKLAEGIGIDARQYVEGLLSLGR